MSIAVVFDSAGTLLHTYRVAKDVLRGELMLDVETTTLTLCSEDRALITLYLHSRDIIETPPDRLLSSYLAEHEVRFGVACACQVITSDQVAEILYHDRRASIGDLQDCIRKVWEICKEESVLAMNSGVMINLRMEGIEFTVTSGGRPFTGAKDTIRRLHLNGIATYIASGDRTDKLVRMADYLGIPHDNVYGNATPSIKAQIVKDLKHQYDTVVMVGDGINDLSAMKSADIAILSEQQSDKKLLPLINAANYIIKHVPEVVEIIGNENQGK